MVEAGLAPHKKGARRRGAAVAFVDETGHSFQTSPTTTWAPVGHAPVLKRVSKRRTISSIVALIAPLNDRPPALYARHYKGSIHGAEVVQALRYFRRMAGQPLIVVWDRLQAHRAKVVAEFVATHPDDFQIEWLPGYAPDLNPEEGCNSVVKRELKNARPANADELQSMARRSFGRLQRRPDVLRAFFRRTHLIKRHT